MNAVENASPAKPLNPKALVRLLLGAVAGAAFGYIVVKLALGLHVPVKTLAWSDLLALWLGIVFLGVGLILGVISTSRKRVAQTLEGDEATLPATTGEVIAYRLQAASLALAGIMFLAPIFALGSISGHPAVANGVFFGILALFALQTVANIQIWRSSDEFARKMTINVCAVTFALSQGALFLWAAAERLHLAPALSSWDIITMLMSVYIVATSVLSIRHAR